MRVLVSGRMAGAPHQGGAAWAVLQYVHGFRALGHDVMLVEPAPVEPAILSYFRRVVASEGVHVVVEEISAG